MHLDTFFALNYKKQIHNKFIWYKMHILFNGGKEKSKSEICRAALHLFLKEINCEN